MAIENYGNDSQEGVVDPIEENSTESSPKFSKVNSL